MRIALDSAILVRANQRATGPARALLLQILDHGHALVLSASVLEEVERVLRYPRLLRRFALTETEIAQFAGFLAASGEIVGVDETIATPISDPKDIHILQTAIGGKAEHLCTLDQHFYESPVVGFCSNWGITPAERMTTGGHYRNKLANQPRFSRSRLRSVSREACWIESP